MNAHRKVEDGYLPAALRTLENAIHAFTEPRCEYHNGTPRWSDSWYEQLVEAGPGDQGQAHSHHAQSIVPFWCDAVQLRDEIDTAIWAWQRDPGPFDGDLSHERPPTPETVRRLHLFLKRPWRPQDVSRLEQVTMAIRQWVTQIKDMLQPAQTRTLWDATDSKKWAACPACGESAVYVRDASSSDGKPIRKAALQMQEDMATRCINPQCRAEWGPQKALFLCKVLGYPVPEGVQQLCEALGIPLPADTPTEP